MIRYTSKKGKQTIEEICDTCKCHVNNLTINDILVKGKTDMKVFDDKGKEVTRKTHERKTCKCNDCKS